MMMRWTVNRFTRACHGISVLGLAGLCLAATGCGAITDKDRIVVAEVNGEAITRGDVRDYIRTLPQPPNIQTRGDMIQLVNTIVDQRIKQAVLQSVGPENVPEVPREAAVAQFDAQNPELRGIMSISNPQQYGMTDAELQQAREQRELGIDDTLKDLQGELAVQLRIRDAVQDGSLVIPEDEIQKIYEARKAELAVPEQMFFRGAAFPTEQEDAREQATAMHRRALDGENFDALIREFTGKDVAFPMETGIQNTEGSGGVELFWQHASGAKVGQILGPIFMPAFQMMMPGPNGQPQPQDVPASYLVIKVLEYQEAHTMSLDSARPQLAMPLLHARMMDRLREEYNVAIFEDNVEDPTVGRPSQERLF